VPWSKHGLFFFIWGECHQSISSGIYIYTERESYICIELYDVIYVYMYYKYIDIIYIYTNKDSDHGMGDHTPDTIAQE
jgi:hypothetical protein